MKAFIFPGQGAQFVGMGKDLYDNNPIAKDLFEKANNILGFRITDIMFNGTDEELKQTKVTQPAVFLHSVISALCLGNQCTPEMVAGHSLGEFSALVVSGALTFEDGLKLVYARAMAMQKACELAPSTMAAIVGLNDDVIEDICAEISTTDNVVVPANYNCPGQLVISGNIEAINLACEKLKAAGARRALPLPVGGAFHSPLMQPAKDELQAAIEKTTFNTPTCPVYQMCVLPRFLISCKAFKVKSEKCPQPFSFFVPLCLQFVLSFPKSRVNTWYMIILSLIFNLLN